MFTRIEPPNLDYADPWKGDLFKRGQFADTLSVLLRNTSQPNVIGLNAPYGFGKTFFLRRLDRQIKNEGGWVIYVNAWEYDYLDSPLLALLDALKLAAQEVPNKGEAKKLLKQVGKAALPAVAKAAGKKMMETAFGVEGAKDVGDAVAEVAGTTAESFMKRFTQESSTHSILGTLREQIRAFVSSNIKEEGPYHNLIIIVDELDRAKPDFSIRFLETIKHLFGLSQVIFLIGCDKKALAASALHQYGPELDSEGYLRRLFDYWLDLPPPDPKQYVFQCASRLGLIADRVLTSDDSRYSDSERVYAEFLLLGQNSEAASLRFIEQCVAHAGVTLRLAPVDKQAGLIGWLQHLKEFSPSLYTLYVSNKRISKIFPEIKIYEPFHEAKPFFRALILIWASNSIEPLEGDMLRKLVGQGETYTMINRFLASEHIDFDRQSAAMRIDRRMRTVTLHM